MSQGNCPAHNYMQMAFKVSSNFTGKVYAVLTTRRVNGKKTGNHQACEIAEVAAATIGLNMTLPTENSNLRRRLRDDERDFCDHNSDELIHWGTIIHDRNC